MRKQYSTSLQPNIIKELKLMAVDEDRPANEVIEDALQNYFKESVKMLNLQKKYNEWRKEAEDYNKKEKKLGGSIPVYWTWDAGEQSAREDFTEYAEELEKEITFEEMQELEKNY